MARILSALAAALLLASSAQAQVVIYPSNGVGTLPAMRSMPVVGYSPVIGTAPTMAYAPVSGYRTVGYQPAYGTYGPRRGHLRLQPLSRHLHHLPRLRHPRLPSRRPQRDHRLHHPDDGAHLPPLIAALG